MVLCHRFEGPFRIMSTIVIMNAQFLYDTHIHTIEVSPCGKIHAAETVDAYAAQGYAGLVITDHFHNQFLEIADTEHNWDLVIDRYMAGYRAAKKRGDEIGFNVIFGSEMRFTDNDNDYLVYGIDEAWLRERRITVQHGTSCCFTLCRNYEYQFVN